MLKRCILAENRKLHASPIWAMFFVLPILSATYGTFNYLQNLEILTDGWYSLWTQHTLFYSMLFFPAMVATYAAYLWRLEHLGHNWNLIMASPVPPLDLFAAKFAVVTKLALLTHGFVFFAPEIGRFAKREQTRTKQAAHFHNAVRQTQREQQSQGYRHKCAVCGRTDVTNPELQFRYCSKCAGYHCFCSDHIFNHVHFTDENP